MSSSSKPSPPSKIADGRFELYRRLGAGCFGEVFRAINVETQEDVAVKFEDIKSCAPQLEHEFNILSVLKQGMAVLPQGVVECFHFGLEGPFRALVMDLLGKSLEDRMQGCRGTFSVKTVALVAEQCLRRIEYLHSRGIVHRDIKPENFMFGVKEKVHHVYLIDFGLSKVFFDKKHSAMRTRLSLTGTARYASLNAHRGVEQSRRDDLEAIGHMLMYFLRGSLPWSGLDARTKQEKYTKIYEKKLSTPLDELCHGYPEGFQIYLQYSRNLEFTQRPDYDMLWRLFRQVRDKEGALKDHEYQWFEKKDPPGALVPVNHGVIYRQPDDQPPRKSRGCCLCGRSRNAEVRPDAIGSGGSTTGGQQGRSGFFWSRSAPRQAKPDAAGGPTAPRAAWDSGAGGATEVS